MKIQRTLLLLAILGWVGALDGCGVGQPPFVIVQVCLRNAGDLAAFTREMQLIAQSQGKQFIDRSAATQEEINALRQPTEGARTKPVVNMGIELGDGIGLTAGNLGLPEYQVAVGFSEGSRPVDARKFADAVMKRLAERWRVELVPAGTGAKGMENCN